MSKKYKVTGPEGEELGIHFREKNCSIMVGGKLKFKPFLEHICFKVLGLKRIDVTKEGIRQQHKYRYSFSVDVDEVRKAFYTLRERYKVEEIESIVKLT
jgi:hypothetical protein